MNEIENLSIRARVPVFVTIADILQRGRSLPQSIFDLRSNRRVGEVDARICIDRFSETTLVEVSGVVTQLGDTLLTFQLIEHCT